MIIRILIFISLSFGANYLTPNIYSNYLDTNIPDTLHLIGIMVDFPIEYPDNPKTSGNGKFLSEDHSQYNKFFQTEDLRCDGFLVDRPPHNSLYFQKQLEAVGNYYNTVSNNKLPYTARIISNSKSDDGYYTVSDEMEFYAKSDKLIAQFFTESIELASVDIENSTISVESTIFIVFHAGLSQDFAYPSFDPTIYDLKSAYVDELMMEGVSPATLFNTEIKNGIILPETQNIIYYDVVEDIFGNPNYGTENLCDIQIGLTGIFAFLLGYHLGLPEMFNIDTGEPGVGYFGLMDHGSNNGRGVMPAPPSPWTRTLPEEKWSSVEIIHPQDKDTIISVYSLDSINKIFKIDISDNEYFLIENRNNWVDYKVDIDSLRRKSQSDENLEYWFDAVIENFDSLYQIEIDPVTQVITKFDHYDYGLPGSGILIWHIIDPEIDLYPNKVVNSDSFKHIRIKEADGAQDIGKVSYAFFASDDPSLGSRWDFWFKDSDGYKVGNSIPLSEEFEPVFDYGSSPNSRTSDGADSFISIKINSTISDTMTIQITFNDGIDIVNLDKVKLSYLGNSFNEVDSSSSIYYSRNDSIFQFTSMASKHLNNLSYEENNRIFSYGDSIAYLPMDSCIEPSCSQYSNEILPLGFIKNSTDSSTYEGSLSFGDIDKDGLDEIVLIDENNNIIVKNANNTILNGFPVNGSFSGVPLIANILNIEDGYPEIICREEESIIIISYNGERLRQFSSFDVEQPLALVPFWEDKMILVDGSRLILFGLDFKNSFWLNSNSRPSGFPLSTGDHFSPIASHKKPASAYNYPNPIMEGYTTFRFYINDSNNEVQIDIYNAGGFLVAELEGDNLAAYEFNEIEWNASDFDSGLYFAEIKFDNGASELVRVVVIN